MGRRGGPGDLEMRKRNSLYLDSNPGRSGRFGDEKKKFPLSGFEPRTVQPVASPLYRIRCTAVLNMYNWSRDGQRLLRDSKFCNTPNLE